MDEHGARADRIESVMSTKNVALAPVEERLREIAVQFSAGNLTLEEIHVRLDTLSRVIWILMATEGRDARARTP